jgi:hypothetical protein
MFMVWAAKCPVDWIADMLKDPEKAYFGIDEATVTALYSAWSDARKEQWIEEMKKTLPKSSKVKLRQRFFEDFYYRMVINQLIFLAKGQPGNFLCKAILQVNGEPDFKQGALFPHQRKVKVLWQVEDGKEVSMPDFMWVSNRLQPLETVDHLRAAFQWYVQLTSQYANTRDAHGTEQYGVPTKIWEDTKEEIRCILIECANERQMIPYSRLTARLKTMKLSPDSQMLHQMLGEVSMGEDGQGRGMLSVLVVHKSGDMKPGKGFFELAQELGRNTTDIDKCWIDEVMSVFKVWDSHVPV